MKKFNIIAFIFLLSLCSCQDDPMKVLDDIEYREKNILSIDFEFDELGAATISRDDDSAVVRVFYIEPADFDISDVEIISVVVSYGATALPGRGTRLDFDNPSGSAIITVIPQVGDPLDWTIYLEEVPLGLEELKRALLEDSYYWWLEISTPWKTVWDVKEYYIYDETGTIEGTPGDESKVRPPLGRCCTG